MTKNTETQDVGFNLIELVCTKDGSAYYGVIGGQFTLEKWLSRTRGGVKAGAQNLLSQSIRKFGWKHHTAKIVGNYPTKLECQEAKVRKVIKAKSLLNQTVPSWSDIVLIDVPKAALAPRKSKATEALAPRKSKATEAPAPVTEEVAEQIAA